MRSAREEMRIEAVHREQVAQHSLMQFAILLALVKMRPLRRTETYGNESEFQYLVENLTHNGNKSFSENKHMFTVDEATNAEEWTKTRQS